MNAFPVLEKRIRKRRTAADTGFKGGHKKTPVANTPGIMTNLSQQNPYVYWGMKQTWTLTAEGLAVYRVFFLIPPPPPVQKIQLFPLLLLMGLSSIPLVKSLHPRCQFPSFVWVLLGAGSSLAKMKSHTTSFRYFFLKPTTLFVSKWWFRQISMTKGTKAQFAGYTQYIHQYSGFFSASHMKGMGW